MTNYSIKVTTLNTQAEYYLSPRGLKPVRLGPLKFRNLRHASDFWGAYKQGRLELPRHYKVEILGPNGGKYLIDQSDER